jgi:hypothetical protein
VASSRSRAAEGEHRKVVHCPPTLRAFYPSFFLKGFSQINDNQTNKLVWTDNGDLVPFTKIPVFHCPFFVAFPIVIIMQQQQHQTSSRKLKFVAALSLRGNFALTVLY